MNISIIFTGGTIGSLTKKQWVGIDESTNYMLLSKFEGRFADVTFKTSAPYSVLSENLSANELNMLQDEVAHAMKDDVDGIIITHGTDTLQYSAAAIEYAFADTKIPIVFVSADYPLDNPETNGYINFEAAVELIRTKQTKGVFVSYKNNYENIVKLHMGSRIFQHREGSANLHSAEDSIAATYENGVLTTLPTKTKDSVQATSKISYTEDSYILSIESSPANSYQYSLENVKAIILKPYHSATLNTTSGKLADLCKKANEKNIPVFVSGIKSGVAYESSKLFDDLKLVCPPYSTYISLYMKIYAAISSEKDIVDFVTTPISNEWAE